MYAILPCARHNHPADEIEKIGISSGDRVAGMPPVEDNQQCILAKSPSIIMRDIVLWAADEYVRGGSPVKR